MSQFNKKPNFMDLNRVFQTFPHVSVDNFMLTDWSVNVFFSKLPPDLNAYTLKMELIESWSIEYQMLHEELDEGDVRRLFSLVAEAVQKLATFPTDSIEKVHQQLFSILASVGVRRCLYILRFILSEHPQILRDLVSGRFDYSKDARCIQYRLQMVYRSNEYIRIFSDANIQKASQILLEFQEND